MASSLSDDEIWSGSQDAWFSDDDYVYSCRRHHHHRHDFLDMHKPEKRKKEKRKKTGKRLREVQELISESLMIFSGVDEDEEEEEKSTNGNGCIRLESLCPYSSDQKILLVGEGDFSFSACLARSFGYVSNMIATSLDSLEFVLKNYKRGANNIEELTNRGCKVIHGVNATEMANLPQLQHLKFDCIVFNFPRAGYGHRLKPNVSRRDEISKNQALVRGFMANAKRMIKPEGEIHITHKCVRFSLEWELEMLGLIEGLRLVEESPFNSEDYPGYNTKYGFGGDLNFVCVPAKTYKFQLQEQED